MTQIIEIAEKYGRQLSKYADPVEDARTGLAIEEAYQVAREDPNLIWMPLSEVASAMRDHDATRAPGSETSQWGDFVEAARREFETPVLDGIAIVV